MKPRLILLASYPKSGNTWLRLVLANLLSSEKKHVSINAIKLGRYGDRRQLFDCYSPWPSEDLDEEEIEKWWPDVYRQFNMDGDTPEFLKIHSGAWRNADGEWLFPPESVRLVLHLTRHPFDIAMSFANHIGGTPDQAVEFMTTPNYVAMRHKRKLHINLPDRYGSWAEHTMSWRDTALPYPIVTVRYEDLLLDPIRRFSTLVRAAGIEFTPETLAQAIERTRFERLRTEEAQIGFLERPHQNSHFFRAGCAGTWQGYLSKMSRDKLLAHCAEPMADLGYGESGEAIANKYWQADAERLNCIVMQGCP